MRSISGLLALVLLAMTATKLSANPADQLIDTLFEDLKSVQSPIAAKPIEM